MATNRREQRIDEAREAIADQVKFLRRLLSTKIGGRSFEQRLGDAYARDVRGGPVTGNDGYRSGGGGPGAKGVASRPTETTVIARIDGKPIPDDLVRLYTADAIAELGNAVTALKAAQHRLNLLDDVTGIAEPVTHCEICARALAGTNLEPEPMTLFTDVGGRLPHRQSVGAWCYEVTRKKGNPPERDRILRRYQHGRDTERVGA